MHCTARATPKKSLRRWWTPVAFGRSVALFLLLLSALVTEAWGDDRDDLNGGVLIAHHEPALSFTFDGPPIGDDWCSAYEAYAITDCESQVNRIDAPTGGVSLECWYVLAAWDPNGVDKRFAGVEFGFDDFDEPVWLFHAQETGACFPEGGGLEIPLGPGEWPGPESGVAIVRTGDNWEGNFVPVYLMVGYAYGYGASTSLAIDRTPYGTAAKFTNATDPPREFPIEPEHLGAMGINCLGVAVCPPPAQPLRACCYDHDHCDLFSETECWAWGGEWLADSTACNPFTCQPPGVCCFGWLSAHHCEVLTEDDCWEICAPYTWWHDDIFSCEDDPCWEHRIQACCIDHECEHMPEDDCLAAGGTWHDGLMCDGRDCRDLGACCLLLDCLLLWEDECDNTGGIFLADFGCDPTPCAQDCPEPRSLHPPVLRLASGNPGRTDRIAVSFELSRTAPVDLSITTAEARIVRSLLVGKVESGAHTIIWDGRDSNGRAVPSGAYYCHLRSGPRSSVLRLVILR